MGYKEKQKYLKGPDKFQRYVYSLVKRAVKHKNFILFVFLAIFLCICGGIAYNLISSRITSGFQAKITAVDEALAEYKSGSYFKDANKAEDQTQDQSVKENKDKDSKADSSAQTDKDKASGTQDSSKSLSYFAKQYENLFLSKPRTSEAKLVALKAAKLYLDDKAYDKALSVLDKLIAKSQNSIFHQIEGYFLMLSVLEAKKDYDQAISKIESFLKTAPESIQATMMYEQARFYIKKQDKEKAKSILTSIVTKYPNSKDSAKAIALQSTI